MPRCETCGGMIKPEWFYTKRHWTKRCCQKRFMLFPEADVLIIGGTSLSVYPAASLIDDFRGRYLVVINKDRTPRDRIADLVINAPIGEVCRYLEEKRTE